MSVEEVFISMALVNDNITYYNKNILRSLPNWNILSNASISGDYITIGSGGVAGVDLSNDYFNGLKASKYRQLIISVEAPVTSLYNYVDFVEVVIRGTYKDNQGQVLEAYYSANVTLLLNSFKSDVLDMTRVISMENYDFDTLTLYVVNHATYSITLKSCEMRRSQDVSGSQIGESIGWGITLNEVKAYLDGCEIFYDGIDKPDKLWWMEDNSGNFSGINVNNERMIKFSRTNEILLD